MTSDSVVVRVSVRILKPSPENDLLYNDRTVRDSDFARLVESVRHNGVQAALLISVDGFVISGHQRRAAAIEAGVEIVPVTYLPIRRDQHTPDEWLAILREHNTGREKSFDERIREALVDIDPDESVRTIVDDQIERSRVRVATIDIGDRTMKRSRISDEKQGMVRAIQGVLHNLKEYLPVSLRAVHYRLLDVIFFRNSTEKSPYQNDRQSYKDLSDVATRMRLSGLIPWNAIADETRPVTTWRVWKNSADFIAEQCKLFLTGFASDLMQSQSTYFEIVAEKLTVKSFVDTVGARYTIPVVVMRGNSSIDARYQLVERFQRSGKKKLFLFALGDCDPDGDSIVESTIASLRDDFGIVDVAGTRVAMTHQQADAMKLPKSLEAKKTSTNYDKFVAKHDRQDCYELDAAAPTDLQESLDTAIRGAIDIDAYNHEVAKQKHEAAATVGRRKAALEAMKQ